MRISVDETDPGYVSPGDSRNYRILLDGKELRRVVYADEEIGVVQVLGRAGIEEYRGKVEILKAT